MDPGRVWTLAVLEAFKVKFVKCIKGFDRLDELVARLGLTTVPFACKALSGGCMSDHRCPLGCHGIAFERENVDTCELIEPLVCGLQWKEHFLCGSDEHFDAFVPVLLARGCLGRGNVIKSLSVDC